MNKLIKTIVVGAFAVVATSCGLRAQVHDAMTAPNDFAANKICHYNNGFAVIDSVDNAIEICITNVEDNRLLRIGHYTVDSYKGRHDIQNILRPVGIATIDERLVFLATSRDSSFIGVLGFERDCTAVNRSMLIAYKGFGSHSDVFSYDASTRQLTVAGFNPTGYDINILQLDGDVANIANAKVTPLHYHVPKQSESIQASDPYGVGLTIVAVVVVFLSLMCIAIVLKGFGNVVQRIEKRNEEDPQTSRLINAVFGTDEEVFAAIAAAIQLYDADMHDEEESVLTIQKVERAWTPWNAKFYNMNQYFNRNRR